MKIAVVGTGALGGWYAARLALAGNEVHCIARSDHAIITRRGLVIKYQGQENIVKVASAQPHAHSVGPCDLVVVTTKSTSNAVLPELLRPLVGPSTIVLTLQNGMGNVEVISQVLPLRSDRGGPLFCLYQPNGACLHRRNPGGLCANGSSPWRH